MLSCYHCKSEKPLGPSHNSKRVFMLSEGEEAGFTLVFQTAPRLLPTLNLPWPPETPQPGDGVPAQGRPKLSML